MDNETARSNLQRLGKDLRPGQESSYKVADSAQAGFKYTKASRLVIAPISAGTDLHEILQPKDFRPLVPFSDQTDPDEARAISAEIYDRITARSRPLPLKREPVPLILDYYGRTLDSHMHFITCAR